MQNRLILHYPRTLIVYGRLMIHRVSSDSSENDTCSQTRTASDNRNKLNWQQLNCEETDKAATTCNYDIENNDTLSQWQCRWLSLHNAMIGNQINTWYYSILVAHLLRILVLESQRLSTWDGKDLHVTAIVWDWSLRHSFRIILDNSLTVVNQLALENYPSLSRSFSTITEHLCRDGQSNTTHVCHNRQINNQPCKQSYASQ